MKQIITPIQQYYEAKLAKFGPTNAGVDWNSTESQQLRFQQLLKIFPGNEPLDILDYGCGYGALVDYLEQTVLDYQYAGYDISPQMVAEAKLLHTSKNCLFTADKGELRQTDFLVASGVFNVKLDHSIMVWEKYFFTTLLEFACLSRKGFAFNVLTSYSDHEFMRPDLYYADPSTVFDFCKRNISRYVSILHDYPLYEFSVLVRMEGASP